MSKERTVEVTMTVHEALMLQHLLNALAMSNNENRKRTFDEDFVRLGLKVTHALLASFVGGKDDQR